MGDGRTAIDALIGYLEQLHDEVVASVAAGRPLAETEAACTDPWAEGLDPVLAAYPLPQEIATQRFLELCRNLHRLNVMATYRLYSATTSRGD